MSVIYRAQALIGVRIKPGKLFKIKTIKAFDHNYDQDIQYCPNTGRKLWTTSNEPIEGFTYKNMTFGEYKVVTDTDAENYYICVYVADDTCSDGGPENCKTDLPTLYEMNNEIKKFKEFLASKSLWEKEAFGLWSVLYCSY